MSDPRQPPKPLAEGSFQSTPFAHVLLHIYHRTQTGTLAVWPGEDDARGQDRVFFREGVPSRARLLGSAATLEEGLVALFARSTAPYAFFAEDLIGTNSTHWEEADPYRVISRGIRRFRPPPGVIDGVLERFAGSRLRLGRGAELGRLDLTPAERGFVDVLRAEPLPTKELIASWGDPEAAKSVLYLLLITRQAEPYEGGPARTASSTSMAQAPTGHDARIGPPSSPEIPRPRTSSGEIPRAPHPSTPGTMRAPSSSEIARTRSASGATLDLLAAPPTAPPPRPGLSASLSARWTEIAERAEKIDHENYFEMLGVDRAAGASAVRDAYFEQVKLFHPDRIPPELVELKPWVERIFHYVTEAKDTLSDEGRRSAYVKSVQNGGGTPAADRKVQAVVTAALEYQKVEVFARRKHYADALTTLEGALALNPDESEFLAMKGFLLLELDRSMADIPVALELANRALELHPRCERAHLTRGMALRKMGRGDEAIEHFRKVVEINPKNIDAAREVRLAELRAKQAPAPGKPHDASGGLLSKFFKKK